MKPDFHLAKEAIQLNQSDYELVSENLRLGLKPEKFLTVEPLGLPNRNDQLYRME